MIIFFSASGQCFAQSSADSLEIYDPIARPTHIPRILDEYFSVLGNRESALLKKYSNDLAAAEKKKDKKQLARLLLKLGDLHMRSDDTSPALNSYYKGLKIAEELRDTLMQGLISIRIGRVYANSEILLSTDYTAKGCSLLQNVKDPEVQAIVNYTLYTTESDPEKRGFLVREALRLQREVISQKPDDTTALENLSKYLNGVRQFDEAISVAEKAGSTRLVVYYLNNYGFEKQEDGKYAEALSLFRRAVRLSKAERLKGLLSNSYHNLGMLLYHMGDYKGAARYIELHTLVKESLYRENYVKHYAENIVRYETGAKEAANAYLKIEKARLEEGLLSARQLEAFLLLGVLILVFLLIVGYRRGKKLQVANRQLENQKEQIESSRIKLETTNIELQESETNLKAAQELALVANWEWNMPENKFSFSEMLPRLFGLPKEEIQENFRTALLSTIHPDDHRLVWNNFTKNAWEPGEYQSSYRIIRRGETRWMLAHYRCITEPGSPIIKINGTIQDITLQKEKEESKIRMEAEQMFYLNLIEQQEAERKRIAFEIHDGIGQEIVAMNNQAELALTEKDPQKASAECLQQFVRTMPELLQGLRHIAQNLRPAHLERMGLTETLWDLIRKTEKSSKIQFYADIHNIDNLLPVEKELHIYRIAQEALSNISKYSGAQSVFFTVQKTDENIGIYINDNGRGFNLEFLKQQGRGFGLHSMEARAKMLGAGFSLVSAKGEGMNLQLTIPVV